MPVTMAVTRLRRLARKCRMAERTAVALGLLLALAGISLAGLATLIYKCVHCKSVAEHDDETK